MIIQTDIVGVDKRHARVRHCCIDETKAKRKWTRQHDKTNVNICDKHNGINVTLSSANGNESSYSDVQLFVDR